MSYLHHLLNFVKHLTPSFSPPRTFPFLRSEIQSRQPDIREVRMGMDISRLSTSPSFLTTRTYLSTIQIGRLAPRDDDLAGIHHLVLWCRAG